jgi:ribulose-phosphate 3-epimerase
MDGQFVPPISFGTAICAAARKATALPLDVHLMIVQPARYYQELAGLGVETVSVHVEACPHLHRDLGAVKALGMRAGVALNPGTPVAALDAVLELVDVVLVMSVNPGWGGQPFLPSSVERVARIAARLAELGRPEAEIEVDGGINARTAAEVVRAGATVLVAGSAAFGHRQGVAAGLAQIRDGLSRET